MIPGFLFHRGETVGQSAIDPPLAPKGQAPPSETPLSEKHSDKAKKQKPVGKPKNYCGDNAA
jgi:hypothetical protein